MSDRNGREAARLATLEYLDAVCPETDEILQKLVENVREIFDVDLCLANLALADVLYPRAWSGDLPANMARTRSIPLDHSTCPEVVETRTPLIVENFQTDERFSDHNLCTLYGIRFYAGVPLITSDGVAIGTLCLLDTRPREFDGAQRATLEGYAQAVVERLELLSALRCEQAAREKEARCGRELQRILDTSPDIIATISLDGVFKSINPACKAILGYEPEELIGRFCGDLIHPDDYERTVEAALAGGKALAGFENRYLRKDGGIAWIEWNATPLPEAGVIQCVAREVTGRKRTEEALRESEERYRRLVESSPDAIVVHSEGRFVYVNAALVNLLGAAGPEDLLGKPVMDLVHPDYRELARGRIRRVQEKGSLAELVEEKFIGLDGRVIDVEIVGLPLTYKGRPAVQAIIRDITERKRAEAELTRLAHFPEQNPNPVLEVSPSGAVTYLNAAARESFPGLADLGSRHPVLEGVTEIAAALRAGGRYSVVREIEVGESSYEQKIAMVSESDIKVYLNDITKRKALEERLTHQAFHDPLTDLPNRALLMDRLGHALARADRRKESVAVLFLDLDNFKVINDSLGHEAGNRLLVAVAGRLRACLRPGDTAARLGGDEFTVLLEEVTDESEATHVAERVAEGLRAPFVIGDHEVTTTASIGVVLSSPGMSWPEELLRNADMAMYEAKNRGKDHHRVFSTSMRARALGRLKLEAELRQAIERGEFRAYYQPTVRLATNLQQRLRSTGSPAVLAPAVADMPQIAGMEALLRWEHPERGLVSPLEFIPLAEETGLIIPIGEWAIGEACRQAREWQERYPSSPPLAMSVNLSARQFQNPDLAQSTARALRKTGLDPRSLILEITESVVMEEVRSTIETLEELRDLGVRISIDDFGTGYSSLSYLRRFPVDFLKIDRSFVKGLEKRSEDAVLVSGIAGLAHALGLRVVAEGVENAGQLARLREVGCDLAQGYFFSRPLPGRAAGALLAEYEARL